MARPSVPQLKNYWQDKTGTDISGSLLDIHPMIIDIIFAVLVLAALIKGYQKGLIIALFSIVAFIVGLTAAIKLSAVAAGYLKDSIRISDKWLPFVAFIIVFIGVVLLIRLGAKLIEKAVQVALLGWLNRIGGMILYAVLYTFIFSIFLFYGEKLGLIKPAAMQSSLTYEYIKPWGPMVTDSIGKVIPFFKDMFIELERFFDTVSNKIQH
jgi:membrane protein required for colicin V production